MASLAFTYPWLLAFLVLLPVIWWLLRLTPPAPKQIIFPAIRLLQNIVTHQQTPAHSPWWLLLLRLGAIAILIVGLAGPVLNRPAANSTSTSVIVIDNDWAAARDWPARLAKAQQLLEAAARHQQAVYVLPTTMAMDGQPLRLTGPLSVPSAQAFIKNLQPYPWPADWAAARKALENFAVENPAISWMASGLGDNAAEEFSNHLQRLGTLRIYADHQTTPIYLLVPPDASSMEPRLILMRAAAVGRDEVAVAALSSNGDILAQIPLTFSAGSTRTDQALILPIDVRNKVARFEVLGTQQAATTVLMDERWRRRPVGLVGDPVESSNQSLLSPLYFIERALQPFADLKVRDLAALLQQPQSVIIVTDQTILQQDEIIQLKNWLSSGGVLIRFAGTKLGASTSSSEQDLLPVTLRTGDRALGGALSWSTPQKLRPFSAGSPFFGLSLPDDVTVSRQVLAVPTPDLTDRTWLALADGTPLVTAKTLGQGTVVLFHIPATADWSNLPISGLFVDMLRRLIELSQGAVVQSASQVLPPYRWLDAFGRLQEPSGIMESLPAETADLVASPRHPPGLYGTAATARAFNLGQALTPPAVLAQSFQTEPYKATLSERQLAPYLLLLALILLLIDFAVSLALRGLLEVAPRQREKLSPIRRAALILICVMLGSGAAQAANSDADIIAQTERTYLAYAITGNRALDQVSESGLKMLVAMLQQRTSINSIAVAGVNPERDELRIFPFIYWPLQAGTAPLSEAAIHQVNDYLQHGGMILFDTREGSDSGNLNLRQMLGGLNLPPLVALPNNHVLKRSFYLLQDTPGRYTGGTLWIEPAQSSAFDGVATVLIGSHDWAGAWAAGRDGAPLYAAVPGGEDQREYAYRFGINLVIYALTGNYKEDQLHAQALLDREVK